MQSITLAVTMKLLIGSYLFSTLVFTVHSALPSGWKSCPKDSPDRNVCLRDAINGAIKSLAKGNSELGIGPQDPFHIGTVHVEGDANGPVAMDILFKDLVFYNYLNMEFESVELDGRTLKMRGNIPGELKVESPYTVSGKILSLPITGDGLSNFTFWFKTITIDATFRNEPEVRDGKNYLVVEKVVHHAQPEKFHSHLSNLFNGNKELGDNMNKVLNENGEVIWKEFEKSIIDGVAEAILKISNLVFSKIPMEDIGLF